MSGYRSRRQVVPRSAREFYIRSRRGELRDDIEGIGPFTSLWAAAQVQTDWGPVGEHVYYSTERPAQVYSPEAWVEYQRSRL